MDDDAARDEDLEAPYPQYRCPICGEFLPLNDARTTVTCAKHLPKPDETEFAVRAATPADRRAIEQICDRAWGETDIDVFGTTFDVLACTNLIAEADGRFAGLLALKPNGGDLAVVLLSVYPEFQGAGVGAALLNAAEALAKSLNLPAIRAAVSNDDISMLYFYQRNGFVIYEAALGVLADALGSAVGGFSDIPVRDEIRLRKGVR